MAQANTTTAWPVNELGEIVAQPGLGTTNIVANTYAGLIPVDAVTNKTLIVGLAPNAVTTSSSLRYVATPNRFPSIMGGLRQVFSMVLCTATESLRGLQLVYANYGSLLEAAATTGTMYIQVGIEYPIGTDTLQMFSWNSGNGIGSVPGGSDAVSDYLRFLSIIPAGAQFRLFNWAGCSTNSIPLCTNGNAPAVFSNQDGFLVQSGTAGTSINYLQLTSTSAARMSVTATDNTSALYFGPTAMIANTNRRTFLFIGDSRSAGQNFSSGNFYQYDYANDSTGVACAAERVFGNQGYAWGNVAISSDRMAIFLGQVTGTGGGGRRMNYSKFSTDIVNLYGTNDLGSGLPACTLLETQFFNTSLVQGKRIWGVTLPPTATTSTDNYATSSGQTVGSTNATRLSLNSQRLADIRYTGGVIDYNSVAEDPLNPGKWNVASSARVVSVAMSVGSNIITGTGFITADGGFDVLIPGAGAAAANLRAMAVYVSPTQLNLVNRITGVAVNASTAVTAASATIQAFGYTGDGIHETQYLGKSYQSILAPQVAAMLAQQSPTA